MSRRQIRRGTFESNSSSMHSISMSNHAWSKNDLTGLSMGITDDKIYMTFGEFGWGYEEYTDAYHKLQYLLTMVAETECSNCSCVEDYYETEGFQTIEAAVKSYVDCNGIEVISKCKLGEYEWDDCTKTYFDHDGYIDHQSTDGYHSLNDFLNDAGCSAEQFIFDPEVVLIIDNDNH